MAIVELPFDSEAELERWTFGNLSLFLGECLLLPKFQIVTPAGKGAVPDGLAFNIQAEEWYVVECELLRHGVWPHIAEQITRFAVALQNSDTLRKIRDQLFEAVIERGLSNNIAEQFATTTDRLLQKIELFIEGVQPNIVIFIDETSQDLSDFAHALQIPTAIYRVRKLQVNGQLEYYSPDKAAPVLRTEPDDPRLADKQDYDVVERLGGGVLMPIEDAPRFRAYKLNDGRVITTKRSKYHEKNDYYWYGINPSSLDKATKAHVSHFVFVLGSWGFVTVPIEIVRKYCRETKATLNADGSVRHYHVLISPEPSPELYWSNDTPRYDLTEYGTPFD